MEIPSKFKEYLDNTRGSLPAVTDPDEPLHIDSLGVIRLVAFLESDLGIRVEDEELSTAFADSETAGSAPPAQGSLASGVGPVGVYVWLTSALLTVLSAVVPPISMLALTDVAGNTCEVLLGHIAQRDGDLLYISDAHQERKTVRA